MWLLFAVLSSVFAALTSILAKIGILKFSAWLIFWNMSEFRELLNEQLKDPEFEKEWNEIQPEMDVIRAMVDMRIKQNLTQKELASRTGIDQADIS